MPISIEVNGHLIADCEAKLAHFVANGGYEVYDCRGIAAEPDPDVISTQQLRLANASRRVRAPLRAWRPFLDRPLPELAAIPPGVDLIASETEAVGEALAQLHAALARLSVPMIKDTTATQVLYLKRPRLVPVCDRHLRRLLGIHNGRPGPARALAVAQALRSLGLARGDALETLKRYSDETTKLVLGAVPLSRARILGLLLSIEGARLSGHPY